MPISDYQVEVGLKQEFADVGGAAALSLLKVCGLSSAKEVRVAKAYLIRGAFNLSQVHQAAKELLCDSVSHEYQIVNQKPAAAANGMNRWRLEVWLKPPFAEWAGEAILSAFSDMGFQVPQSVRVGTVYTISGRCSSAQIERAAARSLAYSPLHRLKVSEAVS